MEALLSQFIVLSDQALQGNRNFDPSTMEDLIKLFKIESYKAWAALELEDYFDSVMETVVDEFRRFEEEMEREAKAELSGVDDTAEKVKKMGDLMEKGANIASKLYVEAAMKSAGFNGLSPNKQLLGIESLAGIALDTDELRRRLLMPQYLRLAMLDSITKKDIDGGDQHFPSSGSADVPCPEPPMIVFINPRSGGRNGPVLKERLQKLISEEQVLDLEDVKPHEFVRYGLACIEKWANYGDFCAKEIRQNIRIMMLINYDSVSLLSNFLDSEEQIAQTVLGCLGELNQNGREPVPPVAIIPLGTGNDLSRSFGWGGSYPFTWKSGIKRTLHRASVGPVSNLDSWHVVVQVPGGEVADPPYYLKAAEECSLDKTLEIEGDLPDKVNFYEGVFYNYFSIGMDAKVAYGFHHFRNEKPHLAQGPLVNKVFGFL
ncbi:hypothetical protein CXB51_010610 [Gossypium anomalum]|uniref:diacylglycerol kinase (ATP) n=1 Tax=Gossypium anomalum TaxID=47600 RepID=A0A8J6D6P5_9ROSI|nr:hypothetical protein CXB51_010610 [Gossypium anomalum]